MTIFNKKLIVVKDNLIKIYNKIKLKDIKKENIYLLHIRNSFIIKKITINVIELSNNNYQFSFKINYLTNLELIENDKIDILINKQYYKETLKNLLKDILEENFLNKILL